MEAGDTFRFTGPTADKHPWIVISDPQACPGQVLLVNMTEWRSDKEQTCILNPADCPGIVEKNSCIYYAGSRVHSDLHLEHLIATGKAVLTGKLPPDVLARIREGAARSKFLKLSHGQLLIEQGLVEE